MIDQKLFDDVLANAIDILRLSANERLETIKRLKEMEKELIARLNREQLNKFEKAKIETVIREAEEIIDRHYKYIQAQIDFNGTAEYVAKVTTRALIIGLGEDAVSYPRPDFINAVASDVMIMGAPSADWWRGQSEKTKLGFASQVRQGLSSDETNQQIITRIVGKPGIPGVMDVARKDAATLVQTSVQTVANNARLATFEANSDVISALRQVSTLDGHTTLICVSYSEKTWTLIDKKPIGHDLPFNNGTPRHWNCRSIIIPITKTFRELGLNMNEPTGTTRASTDGQININTSFNDFLNRKGKRYQNKVLGVGRADLWREGKITLRDLLDIQGRIVSLEELQRKFG